MAKPFEDYAYEKMLDLYNNHNNEVGSELFKMDPSKYSGKDITNCIIYSINTIEYAFTKTGNLNAAKEARRLIGESGVVLARLLVKKYGWKGVYFNADVKHPSDGDDEHVDAHRQLSKHCEYYNVPVEYKVINYRPTKKTNINFQKLWKKSVTKLNKIDIAGLSNIKYGFCCARGGMHTFLFSYGDVYEVHWSQIGKDLYERTPLKDYMWVDGIIVIPPLEASKLKVTEVICK
jgi:hypothetical protein